VGIAVAADATYAGVYDVAFTPPTTGQISSTTTYFDAQGRVDHVVGADHQTTSYTYNPDGSQKSVTTAAGTTSASTTSADNDHFDLIPGGTIQVNDAFTITLTDPVTGQTNMLAYTATSADADLAHLCADLVMAINAAASGTSHPLFASLTASLDGNAVRLISTKPVGCALRPPDTGSRTGAAVPTFVTQLIHASTSIDGNLHATTTYFDALGRAVKVVFADGSSTQTVYGPYGQQVTKTDAMGQSTDLYYDDAGRLTKVVLPPPDPAHPTVRPTWSYTYDVMGNQLTVTDPRSGLTDPTWNPTGKLVVTTFTYDDQGREPPAAAGCDDRHRQGRDPHWSARPRARPRRVLSAARGVTYRHRPRDAFATAFRRLTRCPSRN
jgi:YD repeat-containing protein